MTLTMNDLTSVENGATVLVDGVDWERVETGLQRDGVVLGLDHFVGFVGAGRVLLPAQWLPGRWYSAAEGTRLVVAADGDQVVVWEWLINEAQWSEHRWEANATLDAWKLVIPSRERPWMKRVRLLHEHLSAQVPAAFVTALHEYGNDVSDEQFDDLLDRFEIPRVRPHVSVVSLSGHTYWTPSFAQCAEYLGSVEVTDVEDSVTIYWQKSVQVVNNGVGCTCDEVDRNSVFDHVPECESWDFEVECG